MSESNKATALAGPAPPDLRTNLALWACSALHTVNDAFFAHVSAQSFRHAMRFLEQLLAGSERVMAHMAKHA